MIGLLVAAAIGAVAGSKAAPAVPLGNPGEWVRPEDYPAAALRDRSQGIVTILFQIGTDGVVSNCVVVGSSGVPMLDATTCPVFTARAQYKPSTDKKGKAIVSSATQRIRWQIPDVPPTPPRFIPGRKVVQFDLSETGSIDNCRVIVSGSAPPDDGKMCAVLEAGMGTIIRDTNGTPVRKTVVITESLEVRDYQAPTAKAP